MKGWMAPLRHLSAKLLVIESAATGSHPWARLRRLDWTWRSMFFKCTGRCRGSDGSAQAASACAGSVVLQPAAALRRWDGGVWDGALLGARVACAWPRGAADAGAIREGGGGCCGDLRGGCAADDAFCGGEDGRAAGGCAAASWARAAGSPAHGTGECLACALGGVRDHCAAWRHVDRRTAIVRDEDDAVARTSRRGPLAPPPVVVWVRRAPTRGVLL
jgi:hypothetical protein